jgi:hypothetical protein
MTAQFQGIKFSDSDIANPDEWIPHGEYNPHNIRPWLLHDHGFTVAVAFASNVQEALDAAVDADKLDSFLIDKADYADYGIETDSPSCAFLGNAGEPFDIEALEALEMPNVPRSFAAQFNAKFPPVGLTY